jgi:pimeloyl-ACP methyl ester carboxylesterase
MPQSWPPPEPPFELPPARTVHVPGRGEFFIRDSALFEPDRDSKPVVMLLHGWIATADLNWGGQYEDLIAAGYRVLAIDHRGHGRGIRALEAFRLSDCAADAAGVLRTLEVRPAIIVGYSMGGTIAQLLARDHPDVVAGVILSATAQHFQEPEVARVWKVMGLMHLALSLTPGGFWAWGFKQAGIRAGKQASWLRSEMLRHSARDIAEAGRELGRFDSRPWLRPLQVPSAVVLTSHDTSVGPGKQRQLAAALGAEVFDAPIDHMDVTFGAARYNPALLAALAAVSSRSDAAAA